jgi:hypothetical protein
LTFLLKDHFPFPQLNILGHQLTGYEWAFLYELLQRTLGRKEIGAGVEAVGAVEDFIMQRATEDELLTMLQLMPVAYIKAFEYTRSNDYEQPSAAKLQQITSAINGFLSRIGSPAHFTADGKFIRGDTTTSPPSSPDSATETPNEGMGDSQPLPSRSSLQGPPTASGCLSALAVI